LVDAAEPEHGACHAIFAYEELLHEAARWFLPRQKRVALHGHAHRQPLPEERLRV